MGDRGYFRWAKQRREVKDEMNALLPILAKFGQWNDLIISQLQADYPEASFILVRARAEQLAKNNYELVMQSALFFLSFSFLVFSSNSRN